MELPHWVLKPGNSFRVLVRHHTVVSIVNDRIINKSQVTKQLLTHTFLIWWESAKWAVTGNNYKLWAFRRLQCSPQALSAYYAFIFLRCGNKSDSFSHKVCPNHAHLLLLGRTLRMYLHEGHWESNSAQGSYITFPLHGSKRVNPGIKWLWTANRRHSHPFLFFKHTQADMTQRKHWNTKRYTHAHAYTCTVTSDLEWAPNTQKKYVCRSCGSGVMITVRRVKSLNHL